jgi:hypothetical protein
VEPKKTVNLRDSDAVDIAIAEFAGYFDLDKARISEVALSKSFEGCGF